MANVYNTCNPARLYGPALCPSWGPADCFCHPRRAVRETSGVPGLPPPGCPPACFTPTFISCFNVCDIPECGWTVESGPGTVVFDGGLVSFDPGGEISIPVAGLPSTDFTIHFRLGEDPTGLATYTFGVFGPLGSPIAVVTIDSLAGTITVELPNSVCAMAGDNALYTAAFGSLGGNVSNIHVSVTTMAGEPVPSIFQGCTPLPIFFISCVSPTLGTPNEINYSTSGGASPSTLDDAVFSSSPDPCSQCYCCEDGTPTHPSPPGPF